MEIRKRVEDLRKLMTEKDIDIYIIPSSDYHQSEYVGEFFKSREWISRFTGSAGTVVITQGEAGLWTDGRYFIQAQKQLEGSEIKLFKMGEQGVPTLKNYVATKIGDGQTLGFDGKVMSAKGVLEIAKEIEGKKIKIEDRFDLVGMLWKNRPSLPKEKVFVLDEKYSGETVQSKLERVREELSQKNCDMNILTSLDDIAWIYNLRGKDVKNNPVALAFSIVTMDGAILYIDENKLDEATEKYLLDNGVEVRGYFEIYEDIERLSNSNVVLLDMNKINYSIYKLINDDIKIIDSINPSTFMKSRKNSTEIENLRHSHLKDGIAVTKFMYWLKNTIGKEDITEISATEKLEDLRKEQELYIEPSFDTITAYGANAAMMHYKATKDSNATLKPYGALLVDSGGQYLDGTTDITRTFILGDVTPIFKKHFTLVLKGMINLSRAKFLYGATGTNLDILARQHLWEIGIDYKCGTGHGVGFLLNVHEGPHGIRYQYNPHIFEEGMNITNEPGVYIEGLHGIRLENEMIVEKDEKTDFGQFMRFETITYAPIDLDGIDKSYLSFEELEFLNSYHQMVYEKISPYLNEDEKIWLKKYTQKI